MKNLHACLALPSVLVALGCSGAEALPKHVTLALSTDLALGSELSSVRVDVLNAFDETVVDRGWLRVDSACSVGSDDARPLGTLELETGDARTLRVRVIGYRVVEGGAQAPSVVSEARLPAQSGAEYALRLARACVDLQCSGDQACDPASGGCSPVSELAPSPVHMLGEHCASSTADAPARLAPSDITAQVDCGAGGCGAGYGESCGVGTYCADSWTCAQGVCCDGPCDGTCSRCDLDDHRGQCWPVDFSTSSDVEHCGACEAPCGASGAFGATCEQGSCVYQCRHGYADCNADAGLHDGCEQDIESDPSHCGACDATCDYGLCHDFLCAELVGYRSGTGFYELAAGEAVGVPLAAANAATVLALGAALQNISQPPAHVRIALYEVTQMGTPGLLRAQSAPVEVVDFVPGADDKLAGLTMAQVAPTQLSPTTYWIVMESDKPVRVMSETGLVDRRFSGIGNGVEVFDESLVGTVEDAGNPFDLMFFVAEAQRN